MLSAVLLLTATLGEAASGGKSVRDWTASCSQAACSAETVGDGGLAADGQGYRLVISRNSGSSTGWMVTLVAHDVPKPDGAAALRFDVAGFTLPDIAASGFSDGDSFGVAGGTALERIFPALRKGKEVTVGFTAQEGRQTVRFSLSGLAAVLLWIDDQQGRIGYSDQVAGAEATVASETITDLRSLPPALYDLLQVTPDCSPEDNEYMERIGVSRDRPDAETELYAVPCWSAAYNTIERYFTISTADGTLTPLLFAEYSDDTGWRGTAEMINSAYDPAARQLSSFVKARGLGDCGGSGRWRWEDHMFKMMEYRFQGECGGEATADPQRWPVVYQAREGN